MCGFPIRRFLDRSLLDSYPRLFAIDYVLHRLQAPRHPPLALNNLENIQKDARARYAVLKVHTRAWPRRGQDGGGITPSKRNRACQCRLQR